MKTTVEIADGLLLQAKAFAQREGTTIRALIEAGLRSVLREQGQRPPFRLRDAAFTGKGLAPGVESGRWEEIRDRLYEGRGA